MRPGRKLSSFTRNEVSALFKRARVKVRLPGLRILCASASGSYGRILIVTSRKVGTAPERNLIRRRIRSIYRENGLYRYPFDCIALTTSECRNLSFKELSNALHTALGLVTPGTSS